MRHPFGGGMGAVRCRESIRTEHIAQFGQTGGKFRIVFLFAGVEADVFQKRHLSGVNFGRRGFCAFQRFDEGEPNGQARFPMR